ncbi:uncharacterized protein N7482_006347 [Penicillium canariense]|uniref:Lysine-specific metallo-endopeptidase domain-containing protein n=1 Tax=Penicillium canariense TaxID=189055 RepID=A0A9W9I5U3_9EURO|nr:uncharacterized protein N7482_006347 [Penicillium canariense]KAJ5167566.1 hypothetical protein N7482_006347 [Penicillium canariense]
MKLFTPAFLLATATRSLAYHVDGTCSKDVENKAGSGAKHVAHMKARMEEAVLVLQNTAKTAAICASPDNFDSGPDSGCDCKQSDDGLQQWCDQNGKERVVNIVKGLLGNVDTTTWEAIYSATGDVANATGQFADPDAEDTKHLRVYYGDEQFQNPPSDQFNLWQDTSTGREFMLGAGDAKGKKQKPCERNKNGEQSLTIGVTGLAISSVFVHELIHTDNQQQFPGQIAKGIPEQYRYTDCTKLANNHNPARWKNCDTFAMIARAIYMNNYESNGETLAKLLDKLPDEVNTPTGPEEQPT